MKTLFLSLMLVLATATSVYSYEGTEQVLRASQVIRVNDNRQYFHGLVYILDVNRPKELLLVLESAEGEDVATTRCLLKKTASRKFSCSTGGTKASVRRKPRSPDVLRVTVRNYASMFTMSPPYEITTKVIINTRVAEYTDTWHTHGNALVNTYRKE